MCTVFITYMMSGLGITAGAHRLWAHRAYRATLPLRILLAVFNSMAFQVGYLICVLTCLLGSDLLTGICNALVVNSIQN